MQHVTTDALTVQLDGMSFLEGPRWHDGALYVSDFYTRQVLCVGNGTAQRVCTVPAQPSGLGWDQDGNLLVVSMLDRTLLRLDEDGLRLVADLRDLATGPCNDMLVDGYGRSYVGNFGGDGEADSGLVPTVLVRVDPGGDASVVADELLFPNGVALTADGRQLLVAETYGARITAFDVTADGALSGRRVWADFSRGQLTGTARGMIESGAILPDGIALDADGALWVADAAGSGAWRVREGGELVAHVDTGERTTFSVALGGDDGRSLFLCVAPTLFQTDYPNDHRSSLLSCRVDVPAVTAVPTVR